MTFHSLCWHSICRRTARDRGHIGDTLSSFLPLLERYPVRPCSCSFLQFQFGLPLSRRQHGFKPVGAIGQFRRWGTQNRARLVARSRRQFRAGNDQACRPEIGRSCCCTKCCTNGRRSAQKHPKTLYYDPYRTTTYAKLGRFVIGRSPVQVWSSALFFTEAGRSVDHCLLYDCCSRNQARVDALHVGHHSDSGSVERLVG